MLEVIGNRVLIKPQDLTKEHKVADGISLFLAYGADEKRHEAATMIGTLVGIGPLAWTDWGKGEPWAKVGDEVIFAQYSGKIVQDPETKEKFIVCNDEDIQVRIVKGA